MRPEDSLPDIRAHAWSLLVRGGADRKSPIHTPVIASVDADGLPHARVMVLRKADPATSTLRLHTDARSPKVAQLDGKPVAVLAYHPAEQVQLRLSGTARIGRSVGEVDSIWEQSTLFARRCYLAEQAPGTPMPGPSSGLPAWIEGEQPTAEQIMPARANFAVLWVGVTAIDWLHLANSGHRRAMFRASDGWAGEWVAP
ncbi:pyridoxamine 5'-phosphate oxidase family protein [Sandarakinorhabdus sp. AAP62]|uniref:pyridoxamine 5'-phosphate oxidase family protein n=1 Tax=Sandarakinorhabdus sp. AAP62 TaxID=1248916 RepID=UPI000312BC1A|nr:pyridoxamine 5'-phosphate oxidase family protein [Sandarakinorhabdus sp. AAP62]